MTKEFVFMFGHTRLVTTVRPRAGGFYQFGDGVPVLDIKHYEDLLSWYTGVRYMTTMKFDHDENDLDAEVYWYISLIKDLPHYPRKRQSWLSKVRA
jgi:hypothetical protein